MLLVCTLMIWRVCPRLRRQVTHKGWALARVTAGGYVEYLCSQIYFQVTQVRLTARSYINLQGYVAIYGNNNRIGWREGCGVRGFRLCVRDWASDHVTSEGGRYCWRHDSDGIPHMLSCGDTSVKTLFKSEIICEKILQINMFTNGNCVKIEYSTKCVAL